MMNKQLITQQLITDQALLPLYYHEDSEKSIHLLNSLYKGGIRAVEFTNRGKNALDNFILLRKTATAQMPGLQLGIGTIKTIVDAEIFISAGADFVISPIVNPEVAKLAHQAGLLWIPGCMTPTEIHTAEGSGATLVKIFPGNILGTAYITAIREIFPNLLFIPTGGVELNEKNLTAWFQAGVSAVGMGSKLFSKEILEQPEPGAFTIHVRQALTLVQTCKNSFR